MRTISFIILVTLLFFAPVSYFCVAHLIERNLEKKYSEEIKERFLGDSRILLDGRKKLKDVVAVNISKYLQTNNRFTGEVEIKITISTEKGEKIYPFPDGAANNSFAIDDYLTVASENYRIMNDGLVVDVEVSLERDGYVSIGLFLFFLLCALSFLYLWYRYEKKKLKLESDKTVDEINRLKEDEEQNRKKLSELSNESDALKESLTMAKKQAEEASHNEDGMLEDVIRLEEEVAENQALQLEQQEEIEKLTQQIEKLKYGKKGGKQKSKNREIVVKRFKALYKNIVLNDRAIDNFLDLEEDLKLKCEEVIHQLNEAPDKVSIKRKVFGRKGHITVLEVLFAYKGRLYFRKTDSGKAEVLTVGTKNSQAKELEFLDKL